MLFFCSCEHAYKKNVQNRNVLLCRLNAASDVFPKGFQKLQKWQIPNERTVYVSATLINVSDSAIYIPLKTECLPVVPQFDVLYSYGSGYFKGSMVVREKENKGMREMRWLQPNDTLSAHLYLSEQNMKKARVFNDDLEQLIRQLHISYDGNNKKSIMNNKGQVKVIFIRSSFQYIRPHNVPRRYEFGDFRKES